MRLPELGMAAIGGQGGNGERVCMHKKQNPTYRLPAALTFRLLVLLSSGVAAIMAVVAAGVVIGGLLGIRTRVHRLFTVVLDGVVLINGHPFGHVTCPGTNQAIGTGGKRLGSAVEGFRVI